MKIGSKCNWQEERTQMRTAIPDELVQAGLDPNIFSPHELGDELAHFLDSTWRLLLEGTARKLVRNGNTKKNAEKNAYLAKYEECRKECIFREVCE